ncbi:MAG: GGDEF domain-containing protein [Bacilli bacterium]|nr:GGDEF domain-containing protein [Bacilli bacterium]
MYENLSVEELIKLLKIKDQKIKILEDKINLLSDNSKKDLLTGLYNRKIVNEAYYNSSCIIMCDIDNFKKINDTYGHNGGDIVLKEVSNILKNSVRSGDYVIRWGGEEFLIFVDCDIQNTYKLAERIRKKIKTIKITHDDDYITNISMSFGISSVTSSLLSDIEAADEALYESKENGKDQVRIMNLKKIKKHD